MFTVGVAIGVCWLGERVSTSPGVLTGELISVLVLIGSVALLATRGTALRRDMEHPSPQETPQRRAAIGRITMNLERLRTPPFFVTFHPGDETFAKGDYRSQSWGIRI